MSPLSVDDRWKHLNNNCPSCPNWTVLLSRHQHFITQEDKCHVSSLFRLFSPQDSPYVTGRSVKMGIFYMLTIILLCLYWIIYSPLSRYFYLFIFSLLHYTLLYSNMGDRYNEGIGIKCPLKQN